jgi:hypothetical protein
VRVALDTNILAYAEGVNGIEMKRTALVVVEKLPEGSVLCSRPSLLPTPNPDPGSSHWFLSPRDSHLQASRQERLCGLAPWFEIQSPESSGPALVWFLEVQREFGGSAGGNRSMWRQARSIGRRRRGG